jgi:hypothetical protein
MNPESVAILSKFGFGALLVAGLYIVAPVAGKLIDKVGRQPANEYSTVLVEMKNHMQVIENTLNLQAQTLSTIAKVLAVIEDRTRS